MPAYSRGNFIKVEVYCTVVLVTILYFNFGFWFPPNETSITSSRYHLITQYTKTREWIFAGDASMARYVFAYVVLAFVTVVLENMVHFWHIYMCSSSVPRRIIDYLFLLATLVGNWHPLYVLFFWCKRRRVHLADWQWRQKSLLYFFSCRILSQRANKPCHFEIHFRVAHGLRGRFVKKTRGYPVYKLYFIYISRSLLD